MRPVLRLLRHVRPYWRRSVVALVLLIAVIVVDLAIPRLIQRVIDQGIIARNLHVIVATSLAMLALSVVQAVFAIGNNILSVQVGERLARDLREAMFRTIQTFSFGNLDRLNTGQLMVRLSSDTTVFQRLVQVYLRIGTRAPLLMIGSLVLMFDTDRRLALMMLPILAAVSLVIAVFVARMEPLFRGVQQKLDRLNTVLQENVAGVRLVKAFVRADHERRRFDATSADYADVSTRVMRFMSTLSPALSIFVNAGIVAVIWRGGIQTIDGGITVGQLVAFINYLQTTLGPLTIMVMLASVAAAGSASARRIDEVLTTAPEVADPPQPVALPARAAPRIVFESVDFRYAGGGDPVLRGIDLVAEPGETIAILGATGAGKSSLVNLVPRFYDVTAGRITLDGVDLRRVRLDALRRMIAVVPQETVLFSGSVRDNLRFGRPDAVEAEVVAAATAAQAHEFITRLPRGYDTHVEERGVNLSGGQKQRLAIARALLMRAPVLILDDATSAVDVTTETRLQEALKAQAGGRTVFVVAQRISTVLTADRIAVVDGGRLVAQGTHEELMATSPVYREIYASQLGGGRPDGQGEP
ncbi:MAG: ABC transporter ATP-binding protein [Candidatus Krumholzibacteriia bacterium]